MTPGDDTHYLVGYADPVGKQRGFLLPVFSRPQHNMLQVETWSPLRTVADFADLAVEPSFVSAPRETTGSRIGGPAHWAFALDGDILDGAGPKGQTALEACLADGALQSHPLLALEVAEFLDLPEERLPRAIAAYEHLAQASRRGAAHWRDLTLLTPDFRERLRATFRPEHLRAVLPNLDRVTARTEGDVVLVNGVDIDQHPTISGPILDALQSSLKDLDALYDQSGDWKMTFQRADRPRFAEWRGHDLQNLRTLVYVAGSGLTRGGADISRSVVDGVGFYGPADEKMFADQAKTFRGGSFALYSLDPRQYSPPPEASRHVVGVTRRTQATARLSPQEMAGLEHAPLPTVIIPSREHGLLRPSGVLSGEMREAVDFLSDRGMRLWERLPDRHSVFVRAKGLGPAPLDDAWTQIYGRLCRLGLSETYGLRFERDVNPGQARSELGYQLFPSMREVEAIQSQDRGRLRFNAAVLAGASSAPQEAIWRRHLAVVDVLMHMQGWRTGPGDRGASRDERLYVSGSSEVTIDFPYTKAKDRRGLDRDYVPKTLGWEHMTIVASEDAGPGAVLSCLQEGAILATARDLSLFPAGATGWSLLGSQMRRFVNSLPSRTRTEYFSMFVRSAVRQGRVNLRHREVQDLIHAMDHSDFGDRLHLLCSSVGYEPGRAIARIRLGPRYMFGEPGTEFMLAIEPDGPVLTDSGLAAV